MKRFQLLGVALVAVFAIGVVLAASASASVTFLLAEWLKNGTAVAGELNTESVGTILLEDTKTLLGASGVTCSGALLGRVGEDGLDVVSEVLSLNGELISSVPLEGLALECTEDSVCVEALVWPENLPWQTLLELMEDTTGTTTETFFVDLLEEGTGGKPAWDIECMGTITKPSDLCEGEAAIKLTLEANLLLGQFLDTFNELAGIKLALCEQSKEETGVVETIPAPTSLVNAEVLNASSESQEA